MKKLLVLIVLISFFSCSQKETENSFIKNNLEKKFSYLDKEFLKYYAFNFESFKSQYENTRITTSLFKEIIEQLDNNNKIASSNINLLDKKLNLLIEKYNLEDHLQIDIFPLNLNIETENNENTKLNLFYAINEIYSVLLNSMTNDEYKFEEIIPLVIPETRNVRIGENFKAKIYLTGNDTTGMPICYVGENQNGKFIKTDSLDVHSGVYSFSEKAEKLGIRKIKGQIVTFKVYEYERDTVHFEFEYRVK